MSSIIRKWGEGYVELTWYESAEMPSDLENITSVHGFCFYENKLLLVHLKKRGWEIPGGHTMPGETAEQCLEREVLEEAFATGKSRLLGYILVDNRIDAYWKNSPYPPLGYQLFYRMDIERFLPFKKNEESIERKLFPIPMIHEKHHGWHDIYEKILDQALRCN